MNHPTIDNLLSLGINLEKKWDLENFPKIAKESLTNFELPINLKDFEQEIADWLLNVNTLPKQLNLYNSFGEPPITLFNNEKFAIDVYFWRKNDTLIHSHAFRGAFKVIYGKSLHEEFNINSSKKITEDIMFSNLTNTNSKIMHSGDSQIILPGIKLIHRIIHLENPTVTLCIRTVNDKVLTQWHHLSTGLSYQKSNLQEITIKQILYFQFTYQSNQSIAKDFLDQLLKQINLSSQLSLYEAVFLNEFGLDYEASSVILDTLRFLFEKQEWFPRYEKHFESLDRNLLEHQASAVELKLISHSINSGYSKEKTNQLLNQLNAEVRPTLEELVEQLLLEQSIYIEDYFDEQKTKIKSFI